MNLSHQDEMLVLRHLDGELSPMDAALLVARLDAEPALRECHAAAASLRGAFVMAREGAPRPRAGFAAGVLNAVRQLPTRLQLEQADVAERIVGICRRLFLAAVLLGGIAFAVGADLFDNDASRPLQASPDEIQQELDRLEGIVRQSQAARQSQVGPARDAR